MYNIEKNLGGSWRLYIEENHYCSAYAADVSTEAQLKEKGLRFIKGSVPGNFELDMQAAGMIEDPFFGMNPLELQKLENRHLWYSTEFSYSGSAPERAYLKFEGIDTFADIYLNGVLLGSTDNMFISHELAAKGIKPGINELLVHIKPTTIEARKFGFDMDVTTHLKYNAASLCVRKAAHSFGWDIYLRSVSGGIWRECYLIEKKPDYIEDVYLSTVNINEGKADILGNYNIYLSGDYSTDYSLKISGECGDSKFVAFDDKLWHNHGAIQFKLENPTLWWARDMGEQSLYRVKVELMLGDECVDEKEFNFGVRTIKLIKSETTDNNGSGEFCFEVNGVRTYIRGTNWVALDAFHSRDAERLQNALDMLLDLNCNAVRCWGGNVYEDHAFFDFCDKHGILVWQDFAMGCATYPQHEEFLKKMRIEAESVVRKLRQHPSIALWAGDNECDEGTAYWQPARKDPNKNRITREVFPEVISRLDPFREYLPSSPYVSPTAYAANNHNCLPEAHLWGPRDYFKSEYYLTATAHFASETGYHGCPSPESLKKFISPEKLWPWQDNDEWHIHSACMELGSNVPYAFRNGLMANQIKVLFGEEIDNLEEFSQASQISQGEAVKFFIENFRSHKWRRTGLMWWNVIDGWPQISDAVVDYYGNKKLAYGFIKRSQEPVALIMREPENGVLSLVAANEFLKAKSIKYKLHDLTTRTIAAEGEAQIGANCVTVLEQLAFDEAKPHFYFIEWELDGKAYKNHYISGKTPYDFKQYVAWLKECDLI